MPALRNVVALASIILASARCTLLVDTQDLAGDVGVVPDASEEEGPDASIDRSTNDAKAEAEAAPDSHTLPDGAVVWLTNGHAYLVVVEAVTWGLAKERAETLGGHLATITSIEESQHCLELTLQAPGAWNDDQGPWLGGYQPAGSVEPAGGWSWVTGEPFVVTNWKAGEPNDFGANENRLSFGSPTSVPAATWNDNADLPVKTVNAYVVELE